jgi:hypothetical protein
MPDWAWFAVGAVGGGALALGAGYIWLLWYFTRNNPM